MDDKTTSTLQPSTAFDDSKVSTHSHIKPLTSPPSYPSTSINAILSTPNPSHNMESKNQFDIRNSLMSPPEATPMDSFTRATAGLSMDSKSKASYPADQFPLSPPVSPETKSATTAEDLSTVVVRDPILFDNQSSPSSQPLFVDTENRRMVEEHIAARKIDSFRQASPPRQSEYQLALEFKSQVAQVFNADRRQWRLREMAQLREDNALKSGVRRYPTIAPATTGRLPRPTVRPGVKPNRVVKPRPTPGPKEPVVRVHAVAREDKDFNALDDFSPPVSSLPSKPNSLKVDWKGAPIDLRGDPHASLLHPDELALAANLRLDCATYLTSKRRIFIKRIDALRIGKEFRKTDAQQACKIDVNKASKLWQAFDKVGWLNSKWVIQYV